MNAISPENLRSAVRWGLIGCGDIAQKRVAPALTDVPQSELVAVSRANPDLLDSFADAFDVRHRFQPWEELVECDDVDAVYVATPPNLHAEQTIAAAEAGKHVLCEKPMAMNVAECDRMIAAAKANGVKLGIAYYRQFYPVVKRIKELIDSKEIGKPTVVEVAAFEWVDPDSMDPRAWRLRREIAGGGPMFEFGCHRIQLLLHLFGPVRAVSAVTSNALFDREVEDTATASLEFASGLVATLTVSHAVMEPRDTFVVWCSEGSVSTKVLNEGKLIVKSRKGERAESHEPARNIHQPLIDDFVRAIIEDRQPSVTGEIGKAVAKVEEEVYSHAR
ncbi:MAG TPA: Gfo/Idh/MocA family oxidoreductase [Pyrinomonadaceae bacterium]